MPLQETSGNLTTDAYGGGAAVVANYIEDVFSTYLYTGNATARSITNGIDVSGKGGLVWIKDRSTTNGHYLFDTARGYNKSLKTEDTSAQVGSGILTGFSSTGFDLSSDTTVNATGQTDVSWTWRKQPKYFDIQTWTGTGANRTISHSLGSVPGCIIVKRTDTTSDWQVYHQSLANTEYLVLNTTAAKATGATRWNSTTPTSSVFSLGTDATVNASGGTYVAYIFAHNAGGFGLTSTDNVISCGSFTTDGSGNATVNLGYEPQWILFKASSRVLNWSIHDTMRGMPVGSVAAGLYPNLSNAESNNVNSSPTATGFTWSGYANETFVYVAIRRGPMKVPTDATKVYNGVTRTGTGSAASITTVGFPPDLVIGQGRSGSGHAFEDKLRGYTQNLQSTNTSAEATSASGEDVTGWLNNGITVGVASNSNINASGVSTIGWYMQRAPSFFDEVCYTGNGATTGRTINHNLGVTPELMIVKDRSAGTQGWAVYDAFNGPTKMMMLAYQNASQTYSAPWYNTAPTSSVFTVNYDSTAILRQTNQNGVTFVAYLFATCAGVSKVGSYTGNGTTQAISCGFTGGARFVLIKRTDSTGDWYVYDTARGMTTLTDPYLLLNSTAAETATLGSVTSTAGGFTVNAAILAAINTNAASYIFLAIA